MHSRAGRVEDYDGDYGDDGDACWRIEIQEGRPHGKKRAELEKWVGCVARAPERERDRGETSKKCFATHVQTRFYASLSRLNQLTAAVSDWPAPRGCCACLTSGRRSLSIPLVTCRRRASAAMVVFSTSTPFWTHTAGRVVGSLTASLIRSSVVHSFVCCPSVLSVLRVKRQAPSAGPGRGSRPGPPPTASFSVSHCSVAKRASARVTLGPLGINPAPFCLPASPRPPSSQPSSSSSPAPARAPSSPSSQPAKGPTSCRPKQTIESARPQPSPGAQDKALRSLNHTRVQDHRDFLSHPR